jgi:hypothetical protein
MAITNQYKLTDRLGTFAQTVGRQPLNLPVGNVLTDLMIRVQYTIATGATAPTGVMYGPVLQLAQLIQRMEVIINGSDTVVSVQPWLYLARLINERHGVIPRGMETPINMAANQTTNVDFKIPLHFDLLRGRKRNDCALDLRGLRAAQLYLTFGGLTNLFGTPGGTVALSNVQITVEGTYMLQVPAVDKRGNPIVFAVRQLDELSLQLVGASNQTTVDIDQRTGINLTSLAVFFDTLTAGVHAGDDSGLINAATFQGDFKLKSGGQYYSVTQADFVKARARDEFAIVTAAQTGLINPELAGMFMFDIRYDGKLSTAIPTGNLDANLQLVINQNYTSGGTTMWCQREATRPLAVTG